MSINIPPKVRLTIYVTTGIGSIIVAYLSSSNILGQNEVELWVQFSAFVNGLSALNVDTSK